MNKPLCTLIHISDLHFGSTFTIDGERLWRKILAKMPVVQQVTGWYPHSKQVAEALAICVRQIIRDRIQRDIPFKVIHSGDLTATGSAAQFSVGVTFLRHGHYLPNTALAGLVLDSYGQKPFDIPGNHDLWSRGSPKSEAFFASYYGGPYPRRETIALHGGRRIELYGLDSNRSSRWQHRLANGEVDRSALLALCEEMRGNRDGGTIQVVVLHHPILARSDFSSGAPRHGDSKAARSRGDFKEAVRRRCQHGAVWARPSPGDASEAARLHRRFWLLNYVSPHFLAAGPVSGWSSVHLLPHPCQRFSVR